MMTVMKDSKLEHAQFCMKGNSCVSAATFGLGRWSIVFTHWEVYRARVIHHYYTHYYT